MKTSNAIVDIMHNTSTTLELESQKIMEYIAEGLDNSIRFSRLIAESPKNLGYAIHPDSFFSVTEMLIQRMGAVIYPELYVCDDLRFYKFTEGEPKLRPDFRERYASINVVDISTNPTNITVEPVVVDKPITPKSVSSSTTTEDSYKIAVPQEVVSSDSDSDNSLNVNTEGSNLLNIVALTIAAFVVIQLWAWYDRTYNRDVPANDDLKDNTLNSAHEYMFFFNEITYKLILCLIPTFLIVIYNLRYYYFFNLRKFFK